MKLVMLANKGESSKILYNYLAKYFIIEKVIIEETVSRKDILRQRIRRLGYFNVLGQIIFKMTVSPYLKRCSYLRILEVKSMYGLDDRPIDSSKIINVSSVNSDNAIYILNILNPDIVIVSGTRIISKKVLNCIDAKFINMHGGITPLYRGLYGAYWALVENKREACGVTVHLVDSGIDTGNIFEQRIIHPTENDNFETYPMLQLAAGLELMKNAIKNVIEGKIELTTNPEGRSRLWSHPTIFEYLYYRFFCGIK